MIIRIKRAFKNEMLDCLYFHTLPYRTLKIVSEYDQELPQSQTADNPVAPPGRAPQPLRDTRKTNKAKQLALS